MANTPQLIVQAGFRGGVAEVTVHGDIDITTSPVLRERLTHTLDRQPESVVLDLSGVDFLDCSAARVIAQAAHTLPAGTFHLRGPVPAVHRLLTLTGVIGADAAITVQPLADPAAALNTRVIIEQAKGTLAERRGVTLDEAFTLMRGYARSNQRRLADVALAVIDDHDNVTDLAHPPRTTP